MPAQRHLNILMLTAHDPYGQAYGARLRVSNVARHLQRHGSVTFGLFRESASPVKSVKGRHEPFNGHVFELASNPTGLTGRFRFELDPTYLNTHFLALHDNDKRRLQKLADAHDIVWIHTNFVANATGIYRWPNGVLDLDDIYSRVYKSQVQADGSLLRRMLDLRMSSIWRRRERTLLDRFAALTVCSESDRSYLSNAGAIHVVRNGFQVPAERPRREPTTDPIRFGFIGLLDYQPNRDGVVWFLRNSWPAIKARLPEAHLRLVGRCSTPELFGSHPDVDQLGYVDDPSQEIAGWTAMIVPIRFGGGTRIKIAEAFSRNCPIVSTSLGAFGYEVRDGKELLLSDTADGFADACVRLASEPQLASEMCDNAWSRFKAEWSWDSVGHSVDSVVRSLASHPVRLDLPTNAHIGGA